MDVRADVFTGVAPYEYTVQHAKDGRIRRRQVLLMLLYTAWCVFCLVACAGIFRLFAPLIALVPVSLWILVFFTWRWTQIEYDYSYFSGVLTVARILGSRSRRTVAEIELRRIKAFLPDTPENLARAAAFAPKKIYRAVSSMKAENRYLLLWEEADGEKYQLWLEVDDTALRIVRHYNAAALKARDL